MRVRSVSREQSLQRLGQSPFTLENKAYVASLHSSPQFTFALTLISAAAFRRGHLWTRGHSCFKLNNRQLATAHRCCLLSRMSATAIWGIGISILRKRSNDTRPQSSSTHHHRGCFLAPSKVSPIIKEGFDSARTTWTVSMAHRKRRLVTMCPTSSDTNACFRPTACISSWICHVLNPNRHGHLGGNPSRSGLPPLHHDLPPCQRCI